MNDVERLESLRGRVQHLGTVSIEDTRWLWEMARREIERNERYRYEVLYDSTFKIPPLAPRRKRCIECGGDGAAGWKCDVHGKYEIRCRACGGSGYQQSGNPGEFGGER